MLLTFLCDNLHLTRKIAEDNIIEVQCPECSLKAKRDYTKGKIEGESFQIVDTGFMQKKLEYSQKRQELLHERSADYSRKALEKHGKKLDE